MANAIEVASLFATLSLNDTMTPALDGVGRSVRSWGAGLQRVGANILGVAGSLSAVTAPVQNFLTDGVNAAADFESSLAEIQVRAGLTGDELERVGDFALQMGADTMFSGQQSLDAFLELLTSGSTVEEAIGLLPSVLDAAAASGVDLGATANAITDIMASMNIGIEDAAGLTNALAQASGATSATMGDLMASMIEAGNVAALYGIDYDQLAASFGLMADRGLKGAEAGTALRSMLNMMANPVADVQEAWDELGVSLFDAEGNVRDINTVMSDLDSALDALPMQSQIRLTNRLAGAYGTAAFNALRGENAIEDMTERMRSSATASEVAAANMNTFNGKVDSLGGSIEALQVEGLTPMLDMYLTPIVDDLIEVVNGVTDWVAANPELTSQIVMFAAGAVVLVGALVPLGMILGALGSVVTLVGGALGLIVSPVGLIVAGFGALLAAGGQLETWLGNVKGILEGDFADGLSTVIDALGGLVSGDPAAQAQAIQDIGTGLGQIASAIKDMAVTTFDSIVTSLETLTGLDLHGPLNDIGNLITTIAGLADQFVIQPIVDGLRGLADGAKGFMDTLVAEVDPAAVQGIIDFLGKLGVAIGALVGGLIAIGGEVIGETLGAIGDALPGLASGIADIINTVGGLLGGSIDPAQALSDIGTAIGNIGASLLSIPVGAADGLIEMINSTLGIDLPSLEEIWAGIQGAVEPVKQVVESFFGVLEGAWIIIEPIIQGMVDWFNDTFAAMGEEGGAIDIVTQAFNAIVTLIEGIWAAVSPGLTDLASGIQSLLQPVADLIGGIVAGFESLKGMSGVVGEAQNAVAASGIDREALWQMALEQAGGNDLVARIVFGQLEGSLPGRASGGPVSANRPYLVGERGPEIFQSSSSGRIIPNHELGGRSVVINLTTIGTGERDVAEFLLRALRDRGL